MPYKDFANGFPLFASEIDQYLMNQAVMTFANVGERAAALPTPTEGMITYLADDNQLYKWTGADWENVNDNAEALPLSTFTAEGDLVVGTGASTATNLTVGANGSLLYSDGTNPSWLANSGTEGDVLQVSASGGLEFATPSGGGGWTLLSTTSLSGTFTDISGIDQSYRNLRVEIDGVLQSSNGLVGVRLFEVTVATLEFHSTNISTTGTWNQDAGGTTYFLQGQNFDSSQKVSAVYEVINYSNSSVEKPFSYWGGAYVSGNERSFVGFGKHIGAYVCDQVRVYSSGTATAGTVKIYGGN